MSANLTDFKDPEPSSISSTISDTPSQSIPDSTPVSIQTYSSRIFKISILFIYIIIILYLTFTINLTSRHEKQVSVNIDFERTKESIKNSFAYQNAMILREHCSSLNDKNNKLYQSIQTNSSKLLEQLDLLIKKYELFIQTKNNVMDPITTPESKTQLLNEIVTIQNDINTIQSTITNLKTQVRSDSFMMNDGTACSRDQMTLDTILSNSHSIVTDLSMFPEPTMRCDFYDVDTLSYGFKWIWFIQFIVLGWILFYRKSEGYTWAFIISFILLMLISVGYSLYLSKVFDKTPSHTSNISHLKYYCKNFRVIPPEAFTKRTTQLLFVIIIQCLLIVYNL